MVSKLYFSCVVTINPPLLSQCAGGMHPTGMHSCLKYFFKIPELFPEVYLQFMGHFEIQQEIPLSSYILHK